jgi:uncharacterized damage-inducible protein DinB
MKEILIQLAAYNSWANQKLIPCILALPEEKWQQTIPSSFDSFEKTLLHMWDAESNWWQRLKLQENIIPPSANFKGSMRELTSALQHQNKLWETWIGNASPAALEHVFMYQNSKREPFKMQVVQMLVHVFNHGTYHRGQLVTMLRQIGVDKIPMTDFAIWVRKK